MNTIILLIFVSTLSTVVCAGDSAAKAKEPLSFLESLSIGKTTKEKEEALPNTDWADTPDGKSFYEAEATKKKEELLEEHKVEAMNFFQKQKYLRHKKKKIIKDKKEEKENVRVHHSIDF